MELKGCYKELGADYESVLARLGSEKLVCRFLKKYFEKDEYEMLEKAVTEKDWKSAFMYAHNMKGFGLNLSLMEFSEAGSVLCEALRAGEPQGDINAMLLHIKNVYVKTQKAVGELEAE